MIAIHFRYNHHGITIQAIWLYSIELKRILIQQNPAAQGYCTHAVVKVGNRKLHV